MNIKNVLFGFGVVAGVGSLVLAAGITLAIFVNLQVDALTVFFKISFIYGLCLLGLLVGIINFYKICSKIIKGFVGGRNG